MSLTNIPAGAVNKEVPLDGEEPMNFTIAASIYEINKFLVFCVPSLSDSSSESLGS